MAAPDTNTIRILVADDEAYILQVVALKLRNAGYDVVTAFDGQEALGLLQTHGADLVVTDLQMPHMTGIGLARAMSADPRLANIPVMMLTARSRWPRANIARVVHKPFSPRALLAEIESLLSERRRAA